MIDQDKPQHCGSGGREVCPPIRGSAVRSPSTCSLHVDVSFGKIINPSLFLMDGFGWMDGMLTCVVRCFQRKTLCPDIHVDQTTAQE